MSTILDKLKTRPKTWQALTDGPPRSALERLRGVGVEDSPDFRRIVGLPRRPPVELGGQGQPPSARALALVRLMTERLSRGRRACKCASYGRECITTLLPCQAWALWEASMCGGVFGAIGVGHGKTGMDVLAAMCVKNCKVAALLLPPGLIGQFIDAYCLWREHFEVPSLIVPPEYSVPGGSIIAGRPVLHIIAYSRLSRSENTGMLRALGADLYIADEGHRLRYPNTSTTSRVLREWDYAVERGDDPPRLCIWSGTLLARSVKDVTHLLMMSHGDDSPMPLKPEVVEDYAAALDPCDGLPAPPGVLRQLCEPGEDTWAGIHRRLAETAGVITTRAAAIDAELTITERKAPSLPDRLARMITELELTGTRPDGEELMEKMEIARVARQLAQGGYTYWRYPRGEPVEVIDAWFKARQDYHREVRHKLRVRVEHLDSPELLEHAAKRALAGYSGPLPVWHSEHYERWARIKDTVKPETAFKRVDPYLVEDVAAYMRDKSKGIVWVNEVGFGNWCAELTKLPYYRGGDDAAAAIVRETGKRSILASIKAHGTGRDGLQRIPWEHELIASPPASADLFEQLLGRRHRQGFPGDEVQVYVYRHTDAMRDAVDSALVQAKFIEGMMGTLQKLLIANTSFKLQNKRF